MRKWTAEEIADLAQRHDRNAAQAAKEVGVSPRRMQSLFKQFGVNGKSGARPEPAGKVQIQIGTEVKREEVLEHEVKELRKQVAAARKLEVFDSKALRVLEQNVVALEPSYERIESTDDPELTEHQHVLMYSDLHAAERVSYEAMNGLNEYNWEIMLERHQRLAAAIRSFKRNRPYAIRKLTILGLGDMVTGDIHDELRETNEMVISEAAVKLGMDMASFIATELVPLYDEIHIGAVVGNHGRTTSKPEFKSASKNWDWIAYKVMQERLREFPQVTIELPVGFELIVQVFDRNILCFHGDGIPSNMPGIPWGGVQRRTKELADTYGALGYRIDHFALGHFHEADVVGQKRIWINGSMKGPDEYGMKRYGGGRPACQLLHTFHPTRGLVGTDYLELQ
jgi:transposase-like protein